MYDYYLEKVFAFHLVLACDGDCKKEAHNSLPINGLGSSVVSFTRLAENAYNAFMIAILACFAMTAQPSLDSRIQSVLPSTEEEKWLTIPWRTDLNEARLASFEQRKPIFMWIMNGHPFGCT
ncbi:hypothetical protein QPK87_18260 [Kamptonema cortianum]|nr:hypothetical protein [Geitlerinema splendidum]MDK3158501.1 hypothetical protein [Kamptonema cortianum]